MPRDIASVVAPTFTPFLHRGLVAWRRRFSDRPRPRRRPPSGRQLLLGSGHHVQPPPGRICLGAEHRPMVEELRGSMPADTLSDAILKSVKFTSWVLGLQKQGYKLAMVKDGHVQAVQVF